MLVVGDRVIGADCVIVAADAHAVELVTKLSHAIGPHADQIASHLIAAGIDPDAAQPIVGDHIARAGGCPAHQIILRPRTDQDTLTIVAGRLIAAGVHTDIVALNCIVRSDRVDRRGGQIDALAELRSGRAIAGDDIARGRLSTADDVVMRAT